MKVLGFSGKAQHGKDTCTRIAQRIAAEKGANLGQFALAWPLKARVYAELGGRYTYDQVFNSKPDEVRIMLQQVGTERGRRVFGQEFWTRQVEAFIRVFEVGMPFLDAVAISDVRFPNEVEFVRLGARPSEDVYKVAQERMEKELGYTPEHEAELLDNNVSALIALDDAFAQRVNDLMALEVEKAPGLSLYIVSDRPTLTGAAATHDSEIALDGLDKSVHFDGVIVNNIDTTFEDLERQIRPHVEKLLSM